MLQAIYKFTLRFKSASHLLILFPASRFQLARILPFSSSFSLECFILFWQLRQLNNCVATSHAFRLPE